MLTLRPEAQAQEPAARPFSPAAERTLPPALGANAREALSRLRQRPPDGRPCHAKRETRQRDLEQRKRGGTHQSSQTRLPQGHSNMRVMPPLSESTTARTSFIFLPQMRQVLIELSSTTQIFSARNISMSRAPVRGDLVEITNLLKQGKWKNRLPSRARSLRLDTEQIKTRRLSRRSFWGTSLGWPEGRNAAIR